MFYIGTSVKLRSKHKIRLALVSFIYYHDCCVYLDKLVQSSSEFLPHDTSKNKVVYV